MPCQLRYLPPQNSISILISIINEKLPPQRFLPVGRAATAGSRIRGFGRFTAIELLQSFRQPFSPYFCLRPCSHGAPQLPQKHWFANPRRRLCRLLQPGLGGAIPIYPTSFEELTPQTAATCSSTFKWGASFFAIVSMICVQASVDRAANNAAAFQIHQSTVSRTVQESLFFMCSL